MTSLERTPPELHMVIWEKAACNGQGDLAQASAIFKDTSARLDPRCKSQPRQCARQLHRTAAQMALPILFQPNEKQNSCLSTKGPLKLFDRYATPDNVANHLSHSQTMDALKLIGESDIHSMDADKLVGLIAEHTPYPGLKRQAASIQLDRKERKDAEMRTSAYSRFSDDSSLDGSDSDIAYSSGED